MAAGLVEAETVRTSMGHTLYDEMAFPPERTAQRGAYLAGQNNQGRREMSAVWEAHAMRLIPRWVWKRIPHRHIDVTIGGFLLSLNDLELMFPDDHSENINVGAYRCVRCGRTREDPKFTTLTGRLKMKGDIHHS